MVLLDWPQPGSSQRCRSSPHHVKFELAVLMHRKRLGHPALKSRKLGQWLDSMMVAKRDLTRKLRAAHWQNGSRRANVVRSSFGSSRNCNKVAFAVCAKNCP